MACYLSALQQDYEESRPAATGPNQLVLRTDLRGMPRKELCAKKTPSTQPQHHQGRIENIDAENQAKERFVGCFWGPGDSHGRLGAASKDRVAGALTDSIREQQRPQGGRSKLSRAARGQLFVSCWTLEFRVNRDFVFLHHIYRQSGNLQMGLDGEDFQDVVSKDKGNETILQDSEQKVDCASSLLCRACEN